MGIIQPLYRISGSPSSHNFPAAGGTVEISVGANGPWDAQVSGAGLSISDYSGQGDDTIIVTCESTTGQGHSGTLTISRGPRQVVVEFTQDAGSSYSIVVTPSTDTIKAGGVPPAAHTASVACNDPGGWFAVTDGKTLTGPSTPPNMSRYPASGTTTDTSLRWNRNGVQTVGSTSTITFYDSGGIQRATLVVTFIA